MNKFSQVVIYTMMFVPIFGQQNLNYSKVRVSLVDKKFSDLQKLGIDYDHANPLMGRYVDLELSNLDLDILDQNGWKTNIMIHDLSAHYQNQSRPSEKNDVALRSGSCESKSCNSFESYVTPKNYKAGSMGGYFTYTEMLAIINDMAAKYPHLISKPKPIDPLKTHNGNEILFLRVSNRPDFKQNKPEVLYTALHHAREPNSLSQMIFYLWYLLENYDRDPKVTAIINNTELYFIPCINPDGYIINNTTAPNGGGMWRKNARKDTNGAVIGVDLNRNYGFNWGFDNEGSSSNPFSEVYRGTSAFSEPETKAFSNFVANQKFIVCLNYHSHGNYIVHPWGYSSTPKPDENRYTELGAELSEENCFLAGTSTNTVGYKVNGDSDDWMYGATDVKNRIFSFTPEVGKSFYPVANDIIYLNKSVMDLNLKMAQIVRNYAELEPLDIPIGLNKDSKRLGFIIKKLGFRNEPVRVKLSLDKGVTATNARELERSVILEGGKNDTVYFDFILNSNLTDGENVNFKYTIFFDEFEKEEQLIIKYFRNNRRIDYYDGFENENTWSFTGKWGKTNLLSFTGTSSLTDSPSTLYNPNSRSTAIIGRALDLSNVHKATLKYNARWSIEKDFDYAQIQVSTDGVNWSTLCGKYTRTNNIGLNVYDGNQAEWVQEEIDLASFVGAKNVRFRWYMYSDELSQFDGIYIDEFKVEIIDKFSTSTINEEFERFAVLPNPTTGIVNLSNPLKQYQIYDFTGKVVMTTADYATSIDLSRLVSGLYIVRGITTTGQAVITKILKSN
jgi:hypothetical protein